jgi:hypothetical protein
MLSDKRISDEEFTEMIAKAVERHGEMKLHLTFLVSLPTIRRWAQGKNLAHYHVRNSVARAIEKLDKEFTENKTSDGNNVAASG